MPRPVESNSYDWIASAVTGRERDGLLRHLHISDLATGRLLVRDGREFINFGSNDYLGLAAEPRILDAARRALGDVGWGSGASPLIHGRSRYHAECEAAIASFEQTESAITFATGYSANVAAIGSLVGKGDYLFSDARNHASIIDGCRLSRATVHVYQHADTEHLRDLLHAAPSRGRRLIVSDSLFSMDGDFAPLPQLVELAEEHGAMLLVDEAHATGVWGADGRGAAEYFCVEDRVPVRVGTLSKGLGGIGGFLVGDASIIHWCANRGRSYVFSTAAPAAACAAATEAIQMVRDEPHRRTQLQQMASWMRAMVQELGYTIGPTTSQIVPILLGDVGETMRIAAALADRGFFVPGIRPPSVPDQAARLRISLTYSHSMDDLQKLIDALRAVG